MSLSRFLAEIKSKIVNNLTEGGVDNILSAEQGKVLQDNKVEISDFHQTVSVIRNDLLNQDTSNLFNFVRIARGINSLQLSGFSGMIECLSIERLSNNNQGARVSQYPFVIFCRGTSGTDFQLKVGNRIVDEQENLSSSWDTSYSFTLVDITGTSAKLQVTTNMTSIATNSRMVWTIRGTQIANNFNQFLKVEPI
jgi:hypothetical protein